MQSVTPGTVKAGDELVYEFGNLVRHRKTVKVKRVIDEEDDATRAPDGTICKAGVIILEDNTCFMPDGTPIGARSYVAELFHA